MQIYVSEQSTLTPAVGYYWGDVVMQLVLMFVYTAMETKV